MGNIQVKNVPEGIHEELRRRARQAGLSIRDYVLRLIHKDQLLPSIEDWRRSLDELERPILDRSAADLVREGREERDRRWDRLAEERGWPRS